MIKLYKLFGGLVLGLFLGWGAVLLGEVQAREPSALPTTSVLTNMTIISTATVVARSATWLAAETPFSGDANGNGYTSYELGLSASGPFSTTLIAYPNLSGPPEWRSNALGNYGGGLTSGTPYYVRITFVDPDGVSGPNPQLIGPITTLTTAVTATTVETVTVIVGDTEIFVSTPIRDDADLDSSGVVELATNPGGPWSRKCAHLSSQVLPPKRCRLRSLTPGQDYWIRVTITDTDGLVGPNLQIIGPVRYTGVNNLALNKPITADAGWACCTNPGELVDGRIQNDDWNYGFAWAGGTNCWGGGCPPGFKQATLDLGTPTTLNHVAVWYHQEREVPLIWKVQYSQDGLAWTDAYASTGPTCRTYTLQLAASWAYPACGHTASFPAVTARYLRYTFDDRTLFDGYHGWAVEIEVFNLPDNASYAKVLNQHGQPVAGAYVYWNGVLVTGVTNAAGNLILDDEPDGQNDVQPGDTLVALSPVYTQAAIRPNHNGWAYRIYQTSLPLTAQGQPQPTTVITPTGPQTLTVRPDQSLTLFNLVISVEWDATESYLQDVVTAIQRASAFLYDVTDGQMTLGEVAIYDKAEHWAEADLQISAKNVVQPHAFIGGITDSDPSHIMRVGRFWDGNTANSGNWSLDNGFRTLVHEFGHYGLGLHDEYFGYDIIGGELAGQHQAFCTGPENYPPQTSNPQTAASIMDFHYTTSELADASRWTAWCQTTVQHQLNQGEADWQTLQRRFGDSSGQNRWWLVSPDQRVGVGQVVPGPQNLSSALPFPQVSPTNLGSNPAPLALTVCHNGLPYRNGAWVTLHFGGKAMDQGLTDETSGQLALLGAQAGDQLQVISLDGQLSGSTPVTPGVVLQLSSRPQGMQSSSTANPGLRMWPTTGGGVLDGLQLVVSGALPGDTLTYILTGADKIGPADALTYDPAHGDHRAQVSFVPAALTGHTKVLGSYNNQFFSLDVDYRLHHALNSSETNLFANDGNLKLHLADGSLPLSEIYFLIASPWGLPGPPPAGLVLTSEAYELTASNGVSELSKPAVLSLAYDEEAGLGFETLAIYRWDGASWQRLGGDFDPEHREVSLTTTQLGLYALMGRPAAGLTTPGQVAAAGVCGNGNQATVYLPVVVK